MKKISQLNPDETVVLRKSVQEGLKQSGLYDKGVRVYRMHEIKTPKPCVKNILKTFDVKKFQQMAEKIENTEDFNIKTMLDTIFETFIPVKFGKKDKKALQALQEEIKISGAKKLAKRNKNAKVNIPEEMQDLVKSMAEYTNEFMAKMQAIKFKKGSDACYLPNANKIITPDKTLQISAFHEMGHALNNTGGAVLKALQKCRPTTMVIASTILTLALLNKRKTTDEKSDSKIQNLFDGIKKNAGKLTALAMLPMVAEEGIASLRGGKIAKNLFKEGKLSKEILNKVRLANLGGFATYVLAMFGTVAATKFAIKVKDNIQAKYEKKLEAKYQAKLEKTLKK